MSTIITKKYLIEIRLPADFSRKHFESAMGKCDIEYRENGNPMIFTDVPLEVKQRFIQFYGLVDFKMTVYNLEEEKT